MKWAIIALVVVAVLDAVDIASDDLVAAILAILVVRELTARLNTRAGVVS